MAGRVVHFEIPAEDLDRARRFYEEAFGWQTSPMPDMPYTIVSTVPTDETTGMPTEPGAINGGLMKREGPFDGPMVTIDVDDIDEALATVEKLGGKTVIGRQVIGDMGFTAYFNDPEGNVVGLWQNATPQT